MAALQCSDSASSFASSAPTTDSSLSTHALGEAPLNSVTPTKSLTPRYQSTHVGGAATSLVPASRPPLRREVRHRYVEGGAPPERYLEPLPHHHPHGNHHLSKDTSNGHGASAASLAASSRSLTMGASPMYRNLVVGNGAASPGGSSSPVQLSSTVTAAGGTTVGSSSCITLRPLAPAGGSGGDSGHHHGAGPLSIESRMFPSPLAPSLGPASPSHGLLPHPPSLSSLSGLRGGPRHPPAGMGSSPQGALPQLPDDIGVRQRSCDSEEDASQPLAALLIGSASVPPLAMQRVDSILQTGGVGVGAAGGGPASPMGSFRRQRLPRRPGTLPLDDEDEQGSDSSTQASPYSSWRLDGSTMGADFGTPRTALSVSPGMQVANWSDAVCQPPLAGAAGTTASPVVRLGSPRRTSLVNGGANLASSPTSGAASNVLVPFTDGGVTFWFLPRDVNCTIDSLDDNEFLPQGTS